MEVTMSTILTEVGLVFTQAISWVGDVAGTITGEPLLLIFCVLPLVGIGVSMFKNLLGN